MTPDDRSIPADEQRARDALRALPRPAADPEFRARLGRDFASGALRPALVLAGPAWFRRPEFLMTGGALAVAAAALIVAVLNPAPPWRVVSTRGTGTIAVAEGGAAERLVPVTESATLGKALTRASHLAASDSAEITLASDGVLALRLLPGTRISLTPAPGRWFGRQRLIRVEAGELFVTTQPAFRGARLDVRTREATVQVVGTSFAVLAHDDGTCVCVMDGMVQVTPEGGPAEMVPPGRRCFVYRDGRPIDRAPILEESASVLGELERVAGGHGHH